MTSQLDQQLLPGNILDKIADILYRLTLLEQQSISHDAANGRYQGVLPDLVQVSSTYSTSINTATPTAVQWDKSNLTVGDSLSHNPASSNNLITVNATGYYRLTVRLTMTGLTADTNVRVRFRKNGTSNLLSYAANSHISGTGGHNESSASATVIALLTDGDYVEVTTEQEAAAGSVTLVSAESVWAVERLDRYVGG